MPIDQFIRVVRARWLLVASIMTVVLLSTLIVSLILPKRYTATATLMVDIKPDPVAGFSVAAQPGQYIATQVDLVKSGMVSLRVVRDTKIGESPDMRERWVNEASGQGNYESWVGDMLGKGLEVRPAKDSSLINISYEGTSAAFAASMANAYAKAYMDSTVQLRVSPAKQYADFFEERARLARERLEAAQNRLSEAQQSNGIVLTDERLDYETQRLNELSSQITQLRAIRAESDSRNVAATQNPERVQDVVNSNLLGTLKAQLAGLEAQYNESTMKYGDNHPMMKESLARIEDLRNKIRSETGKIAASVNTSASINASREGRAHSDFEAQRDRVLKLKSERAKLQVLERDVESAQRILDSLQTRLSQVSLESNSSQSNVYLVNEATSPNKHTSPKLMLNMALALVLGLFVSIMAALGLESMDRRVRGPIDIAEYIEIPVIGVLPSPHHSRGGLRRLLTNQAPGPSLTTVGSGSSSL